MFHDVRVVGLYLLAIIMPSPVSRQVGRIRHIYACFTLVHCLVSQMFSLFQPREQAGFRSGFSTIDHIHVISQLHDNTDEYRFPHCFTFVDYEKPATPSS